MDNKKKQKGPNQTMLEHPVNRTDPQAMETLSTLPSGSSLKRRKLNLNTALLDHVLKSAGGYD